MRAFAIDRFGSSGTLHELPTPIPEVGEVLVRVTAAGVNPIDWKVAEGEAGARRFPFVLGQDFAGVVERVGSGVRRVSPGDRLFGVAYAHGAYAEYTIVPESSPGEPVAKIPPLLHDQQAAALPTAGMTALAVLAAVSVPRDGVLLIVGATGGVGYFTTQIACHRGLQVIATTHSGNEDLARALGARDVIAYDRTDAVVTVKAAYPQGVDAVIDLASRPDAIKSWTAIVKPGGKIVSTIGSADEAWFHERGIAAHNINAAATPQWSPETLELLASMVLEGMMKVDVADVTPLARADEALKRSKSGTVSGKLVLTV